MFDGLKSATGPELNAWMTQAEAKRDAQWGRVVTYSRKVFIPLVNLCRDVCAYCTFAKNPNEPGARYLTPDEVMAIARKGQALGCKEALFSLGERPEARWPQARAQLEQLGFSSTHAYLRHCCARVLAETTLIPHANPGTLTEQEMRSLAPVTGSMGMMMESVSSRLMQHGHVHHACPDKEPALRLQTLHTAAALQVPFTTGLLIGIGENWQDRVDTLKAIRDAGQQSNSIQEVIVQNFRAKDDTRMAKASEPDLDDMLRTIVLARLILPPHISVQAPPNLGATGYGRYVAAGINDWGGVSPLTLDHINPERAWPAISELKRITSDQNCKLKERLTVYPRFLDNKHAPAVRQRLESLRGPDGLALHQVLT